MMHRRRIGDWEVCNIVEYAGPTHDPARVFPDLDPALLPGLAPCLGIDQYVPHMNRFVVAIQLWVARREETVVVVDGGVGNAKDRGVARQRRLNTRTLDWLEAAGATRGTVTHMVNTHLHADHVGWNTQETENGPELTFPDALHVLPAADIEHFGRLHAKDARASDGSYADSVIPVLERAETRIVDGPGDLCEDIRIVPAPGHTPGMFNLHLESNGETGVFCADIFHSPLQILHPEVNTAFCILQDDARATRAAFLDVVADTGTVVMPCHFGFPHAATVTREGNGYGFIPALPILPA